MHVDNQITAESASITGNLTVSDTATIGRLNVGEITSNGAIHGSSLTVNGNITSENITLSNRHIKCYNWSEPGANNTADFLTLNIYCGRGGWSTLSIDVFETHTPDNGGDRGGGRWYLNFSYTNDIPTDWHLFSNSNSKIYGYGGDIEISYRASQISDSQLQLVLIWVNFRNDKNKISSVIEVVAMNDIYIQ